MFVLVFDAEQRRLGDVDVAAFDQLVHLAVEEREQQRADVGAVDVGIGHDHDLAVAGARRDRLSSPMPVPMAEIMLRTSSLASTLSSRDL